MKNQPVHVASYHKGHPNPQRYRENYESWNGAWNFAFDEPMLFTKGCTL